MKLFIAIMFIFIVGCTDPEGARRVLKANGFSEIQIHGYDFWSCSQDDAYHTAFSAKGPTGVPVKGTVCAGLFFKNSTIRFE